MKPSLFQKIASAFRVFLFRCKGMNIGKNVYIGKQVNIRSSNVNIGSDCYLLDNVSITAKEICLAENVCIYQNCLFTVLHNLSLGAHTKISRNCVIKAAAISAEHDLWCNENVEVGGGGFSSEDAILQIGPHMHIGKGVHINVCKPVILKGYSGIGIGCMIFTHSAGQGQSVFRGYPFVEAPVTIGKHVSLYTNVIVSPGTTIEDGVTVATMSLVRGHLLQNGFYAGSPAVRKKNAFETIDVETTFLTMLRSGSIREGLPTIPLPDGKTAWLIQDSLPTHPVEGDIVVYTKKTAHTNDLSWARTWIVLSDSTIHGRATESSEWLRDTLRRHGVILEATDGYRPLPINPFHLCQRGVEV